MGSLDWQRVLQYLFENEAGHYLQLDEAAPTRTLREDLQRDIRRRAGLEKVPFAEFEKTLNRLEHHDLIEYNEDSNHKAVGSGQDYPEWAQYVLTPRGVEFAHERDLSIERKRTQSILAILTAGLVLTSGIQAMAAIYPIDGPARIVVTLTGTLLVIFLIVLLVLVLFAWEAVVSEARELQELIDEWTE